MSVPQLGHHGAEQLYRMGVKGGFSTPRQKSHPFPQCEKTKGGKDSPPLSSARQTSLPGRRRRAGISGWGLPWALGSLHGGRQKPLVLMPTELLQPSLLGPSFPLTWGHVLGLQADGLVLLVSALQPGCAWQGRFPPHLRGGEKVILEEFFLWEGNDQ